MSAPPAGGGAPFLGAGAPLPGPGRIVALFAGPVRTHDWPDPVKESRRTWTTAYIKDPIRGEARIGALGVDGDEHADRKGHGGPDRALLAYADSHYPVWRDELGLADMGPGGFGENLTVTGFDERSVCVGDVFEAGEARIQVAQPREPCSNISRRWRRPDMVKRVVESRRFGWYMRVLREGSARVGAEYRLVERPFPEWVVARAFEIKRDPAGHRADVARLAACPALSEGWRAFLGRRLVELGAAADADA